MHAKNRKRMSKRFLPLAILLLVNRDVFAKCANRIIHVEGSAVGVSGEGLKVALYVVPEPNWEPQPDIRIENGKFAGTVLFDSTKSEGRVRDNCSRAPRSIRVLLFRNDQQIALRQLSVAKDFVKSKNGDYRLRAPIVLKP